MRKDLLLSGSSDATIKIWDLKKMTPLVTHSGFVSEIKIAEWSNFDESIFFGLDSKNNLKICDVRTN